MSPGGREREFVQFMESLKKNSSGVYMLVTGPCASACGIWATKADQTIVVSYLGQIGLHRGTNPGAQEEVSIDTTIEVLARHGANEEWMKKNRDVFVPNKDVHGLTREQMLKSGFADLVMENPEHFDYSFGRLLRRR